MTGHIKLDGREYSISPGSYRQSVANPMAAKTSQGSSKYDDQQDWDYFVQENWSGGIGKSTIDLTGAAFSVGDSRFSNQFKLLAPFQTNRTDLEWGYSDVGMTDGYSYYKSLDLGDTATSGLTKLAFAAADNVEDCTLYVVTLRILTPSADTTVTASLYSATSSSSATPTGSALDSGTFTVYSGNLPGYQPVSASFEFSPGVATGRAVVVFECTSSITLLIGLSGMSTFPPVDGYSFTGMYSWYDSGSTSWKNSGVTVPEEDILGAPAVRVFAFHDPDNMDGVRYARDDPKTTITWNGDGADTVGAGGSGDDYWKDTPDSAFGLTAGSASTDALSRAGVLYVAYGSSSNLVSWDYVSTETDLGVNADKIDIGGGYFWRSYNKYIYYSANLSTWTSINVYGTVIDVRWYGDFLYYLTNEGLSRIGFGDAPLLSAAFDVTSDAKLYVWQNRLYIMDGSHLMEFDEASIRDISPLSGEGPLPDYTAGNLTAINGTNTYLFVAISAYSGYGFTGTNYRSGIYIYNGQGWSCGYLFGDARTIHDIGSYMISDTELITLHCLTSFGQVQARWADVPILSHDTFTVQGNDDGFVSGTSPSWLETPWLYGGLVMLEKDWESVFVAYNLPSDLGDVYWKSSIYWKEADEDAWTLLGSADFSDTGGTSEFRWSNLVTRPSSAKIKIGLLHQPTISNTQFLADTGMTDKKFAMQPALAALRIKYHAMVEDRWQWNFTVPISKDIEKIDGTLDTYTFAQQVAHMDSLIVNKTPPFIFQDVDGTQYEVKVLSGTKGIEQYRGPSDYKLRYNLSIVMVTTEAYTP